MRILASVVRLGRRRMEFGWTGKKWLKLVKGGFSLAGFPGNRRFDGSEEVRA